MRRFALPGILLLAIAARAATQERGQLDASPAIFTVMAAINVAGYDAELSSANNHPLRAAIRQELAGKKISSLQALKQFYIDHRQGNANSNVNQYFSFALAVDGPPLFGLRGRAVDAPPDVTNLDGLQPLLAAFYREANIEDLWKRSQPAFEQAIERYHEGVSAAVLQVNGYLRNQTSGVSGRRFQIYIDLLSAPNQIQTRSYGNEYFVVVTPSAEPRIHDVRHAYLHYLLDPMATHNAEIVMRKRGLADHAQRAVALDDSFKSDYLLLVTESLIRAIEARIDRKPDLVPVDMREGFILTAYFSEELPVYEKQEQAMRLYYPDLIKAIDLKHEDIRLSHLEFVEEARVRQAKVPAAPPPPVLEGAYKTLDQAEQLYTDRSLEPARQLYLKVLEETPDKPMHAKAYYGLARVATLEKNPELAERLFQKTLECEPEPQVRAWTLVYLGRLSDAAGDREEAVKHYQEALAVEGASPAAHQAAEQGAQRSLQKPN